MDLTNKPKKLLFNLAKDCINSNDITFEDFSNDSFYESGDMSDLSRKIYDYINERGLYRSKDLEDPTKFFYSFIKKNLNSLFSDDFVYNESEILVPEMNSYVFFWDTTETATYYKRYEHSISSWLDQDQIEDEIDYHRYQGNIYPEDGDEISSEIQDSNLEDDHIRRIRKIS